jgi:predicted patatin/cPLA2 family phospholipase
MRGAYTTGVVRVLLEHKLYFKDCYGISSGSSHAVNYISRDARRDYLSFVDYFMNPKAAGVKQFLLGNGYFNAKYIYQESGLPMGVLPFDFDSFTNSSTQMHIDGFEADTAKTKHWTKVDAKTLPDLMLRVQASSSLPIFMPKVSFDGHVYYDGGLGDSWGIMLDQAIADGYKRFFIVRTQERGYRKSPPKNMHLNKLLLFKYPSVVSRMAERWRHYNQICDRLDELELSGDAMVFTPEHMDIKSSTLDIHKLRKAAKDGYDQALRELPELLEFL